jgi:hypothetical protein
MGGTRRTKKMKKKKETKQQQQSAIAEEDTTEGGLPMEFAMHIGGLTTRKIYPQLGERVPPVGSMMMWRVPSADN